MNDIKITSSKGIISNGKVTRQIQVTYILVSALWLIIGGNVFVVNTNEQISLLSRNSEKILTNRNEI